MTHTPRPHLILLGGFLGAGKTQAMRRLAGYLTDQGIRTALITNDQGNDLVDTRLLQACGFTTAEIPGGCFCCRFDALVDTAMHLTATVRPEIFVAEAVGSCTDLVATVAYPFRRLYGDGYTVAPLSVLVDPIRAQRVFGLATGERFSPNVEYIFRKQLEEADIIVISKCDVLRPAEVARLRTVLERAHPLAEVLAVSTREGIGVDDWFRRVTFGEPRGRAPMDLDYDRYAAGEARLGWLNAELAIAAKPPHDGDALLTTLAMALRSAMNRENAEIAHLKMTLAPRAIVARAVDTRDATVAAAGDGPGAESPIATINLVRSDIVAELGLRLGAAVSQARVVVNLRAEAAPEALERALHESLGAVAAAVPGVQITVGHTESFRPGRPTPTHRDAAAPA